MYFFKTSTESSVYDTERETLRKSFRSHWEPSVSVCLRFEIEVPLSSFPAGEVGASSICRFRFFCNVSSIFALSFAFVWSLSNSSWRCAFKEGMFFMVLLQCRQDSSCLSSPSYWFFFSSAIWRCLANGQKE